MKFKLTTIVLVLSTFCRLWATGFPSYILFKSYTVQCLALDSIHTVVSNKAYLLAVLEWKELETEATKKGDKQLIYGFEFHRYLMAFEKGKTDKDFEKDVLELIKNADNTNYICLKADALELLAEHYWRNENFASCLENYINAYENYSKFPLNEFPHKAEYLCQFGGKYYYFRDFKTAKRYFLEAIQNIPTEKLKDNISKLNTLALCYSNLEEYDSASYYFHKAIDCAIKYNSEAWIGFISGNLGNIYLKQNKIDEAIPLFEKNIELDRKHSALGDLAISLSDYGAILLLKNEPQKDMEMQLEALQIVREKKMYGDIKTISRIYSNVAKAYAANRNKALAYTYLDSARNAKDSLEKKKNIVFMTGVQHKIDVERHITELQKKEAELKQQKLFRNSLLIGFFMLLLLVFFILKILSNQKKSNILLSFEKQKSEMLLRNILPDEVADELKESGSAKAKHFENVSVLFTDFVGFTLVSEKLSPDELVEEIHQCFTAFDEIIDRNGLEKIKTIGDAYLAVCGLPSADKNHAKKTVQAAMEIMEFIKNREKEGGHFEIRIGINSGPVVAGIVGVKKFAYDIWGDTVNTAARMEQHSQNGKINVSGSTYELIKNDFKCIHRGKIEAKNKGEVDMYFVEKLV